MNTQQIVTWPYRLRSGHSANPAEGACAMDAINWLVHGRHGDHPECACPVIAAFVIPANDAMPDGIRQRFLVFLPRIAGSRSQGHIPARLKIIVAAAQRWADAAARAGDAAWAAWAATWAARAADAAAWAARAAAEARVWDDYFAVLDAILNAGPQGEPWSVDAIDTATDRYVAAGGVRELVP